MLLWFYAAYFEYGKSANLFEFSIFFVFDLFGIVYKWRQANFDYHLFFFAYILSFFKKFYVLIEQENLQVGKNLEKLV